jgi:hypothetical protein
LFEFSFGKKNLFCLKRKENGKNCVGERIRWEERTSKFSERQEKKEKKRSSLVGTCCCWPGRGGESKNYTKMREFLVV